MFDRFPHLDLMLDDLGDLFARVFGNSGGLYARPRVGEANLAMVESIL